MSQLLQVVGLVAFNLPVSCTCTLCDARSWHDGCGHSRTPKTAYTLVFFKRIVFVVGTGPKLLSKLRCRWAFADRRAIATVRTINALSIILLFSLRKERTHQSKQWAI